VKIFIQNGFVGAWHKNEQDVDSKYPGHELLIAPDDLQLVPIEANGFKIPDPRLSMTAEELVNVQTLTEDYYSKKTSITDNFPAWSEIDTKLKEIEDAVPLMANLNDAKIILGKIITILRKDVRVTYWLAKGTQL
jgi:hypothetical protein